MCVFGEKRLSSQGNQGHIEILFFLVLVAKISHFFLHVQPLVNLHQSCLDSQKTRTERILSIYCLFFSFISLNNVWLLLDLQNVQISAVCAFPPLYSQLSSPPYLFIYLRSQQLPLIFLQKLNTPVACVIISASLWQRVCTPRFFFFFSFILSFFFFSIFALMLLQLLIMWR